MPSAAFEVATQAQLDEAFDALADRWPGACRYHLVPVLKREDARLYIDALGYRDAGARRWRLFILSRREDVFAEVRAAAADLLGVREVAAPAQEALLV